MGQYQQPPPPGYGAPPPQQYGMEPPEAGSIKSMVNIASIFGILFAVVFILLAVYGILMAFIWSTTFVDPWTGDTIRTGVGAFTWVILIMGILGALFGFLFFMQCRGISNMVDRRQYEQAKSKTLIWMIIGIIFVGLIPGILLLIAYLKFDSLINATRGHGYGAPQQYQQPQQQQYQQPQQQHHQQPQQQHHQQPQQQQQRTCMGCGRQIPTDYRNCPHCGRQMGQ